MVVLSSALPSDAPLKDDAANLNKQIVNPAVDRYEVVTAEAAFQALKGEWDDLYRRAVNPRFTQSFDWCWCSWEFSARPRGHELCCLVVRNDAGRVVSIWPFMAQRRFVWTFMRPLGPDSTEYSDVLVEEGGNVQERIAAAWRALCAACGRDVIRLPFVREGSQLYNFAHAEKGAFAFHERFATRYVGWRGYADWDSYVASLAKKQRNDLGRRRRRLDEAGEVTIGLVTDPAEREAVIDWALPQKKKWLQQRGKKSIWLGSKMYRNVLVAVAGKGNDRERMVVWSLQLNGEIIAAELARIDLARIECFLSVYDPVYRKFSPSHMLRHEYLKWAFERGLYADFRLGEESYKEYWTNDKCDVEHCEFVNTLWGITFIAARKAAGFLPGLKNHLRSKAA